jgi:hypothetical protein
MKKIGIILAIVVALTLVAGCASSGGGSSGGGKSGGGDTKPFSVDMSNLEYKIFNQSAKTLTAGGKGAKNATPLAKRWDGVLFLFPDTAFAVDVSQYKRITINGKYYNEKGEEIPQADGRAMVVLVYDVNGDLEGPEMGPGKNTPLKEFNLGGFSGAVSTDKGSRLMLAKAPGGILLQAADPSVKFIELTQVTLHNSTASGAD